jgi:hypothetical protein
MEIVIRAILKPMSLSAARQSHTVQSGYVPCDCRADYDKTLNPTIYVKYVGIYQ